MGKFNSKRFTLIAASFLVLSFMGVFAMWKGMEAVAVTVATALAGIVAYYTNQETKRPSNGK